MRNAGCRFGLGLGALLALAGCAMEPAAHDGDAVAQAQEAVMPDVPAAFDFDADFDVLRGSPFSPKPMGSVSAKARVTITDPGPRGLRAELRWLSGPLASEEPIELRGGYHAGEQAFELYSDDGEQAFDFASMSLSESAHEGCRQRGSIFLYIVSPGREPLEFRSRREPRQDARVIFQMTTPCDKGFLGLHLDWLKFDDMRDVVVR